jgi:hypothetical protein
VLAKRLSKSQSRRLKVFTPQLKNYGTKIEMDSIPSNWRRRRPFLKNNQRG